MEKKIPKSKCICRFPAVWVNLYANIDDIVVRAGDTWAKLGDYQEITVYLNDARDILNLMF